ncbi:MAG: hypothetical protein ABI625_16970 [bacterium]
MTATLGTGLLLVGGCIVFLVSAVVRKGPAFEYAWALFFGEFGMVFIAGAILPSGPAGKIVALLLVASMLFTWTIWLTLFRQFQRSGARPQTR